MAGADDADRLREERREYLDERNHCLQSEARSAEQFDKAVLTLAAGALGLSMTFIKDIVPVDQRELRWLIVVGWLFFSLSILATLLSFLTSQRVHHEAVDILDDIMRGKDERPNC